MNYFIFKGVNSNEFKGLVVNTLPPITKAPKRVETQEIDGVDGEIITELGYSAYDKEIIITLINNNDIDNIIEWLNGEGELVTSLEPNKSYKARIIDQIDYERLYNLKSATITFRVQPFKYEYEEAVSSLNSYSPEGKDISINKSDIKLTQVKVEGECEQETTQGYNLYNNEYKISDNGLTSTKEQIENGVKVTITAVNSAISQPGFFLNIKSTIDNLGLADGENILIKYKFKTTNTSSFNQSFGNWEAGKNLTWSPSVSQTYTNWTERRVLGKFNATAQYGQFSFYSPNISVGDVYEIKDFMISKSSVDLPYEQYTGGSASPNPDYPSEISTISNGIEVEICGKNLIEPIMASNERNGITCTNNGDGTFTLNGTATKTVDFRLDQDVNNRTNNLKTYNGDYTLSCNELVSGTAITLMQNSTFVNCITARDNKKSVSSHIDNMDNMFVYAKVDEGTILNNLVIRPMLEKGTKATEWEAYKGSTTLVSLNDNELCSIGDIKDELIIENGKAKIIKRIGKVVLDGTLSNITLANGCYQTKVKYPSDMGDRTKGAYCKYFKFAYYAGSLTSNLKNGEIAWNGSRFLTIKNTNCTSIEEYNTWLSNNNVILYYPLEESKEIDLGTTTTINTYEGITNISNNSDANMVVNYVDNKLIVTNLGNYISKPVITIRGQGTIEFTLNNEHLFNYTFPEGEEEVVIDSQKQDAYLGTILKNRNMIGEFPIFKVGANTITWNGHITSIDISSKSRWL